MQPETVLVLATRNRGKTEELRSLLGATGITIKNLNDFGPTPEVVEDGATFDENAYKKSSFYSRILGLPAMADDSGLVVEALGGAPGVLSARYGGENATDEDRFRKLLAEMTGQTNRAAAFECVISIAVPTGAALTYEGRCQGVIADAPAGDGGFGYDPIFYYPPLKKTFAEMNAAEKNQISHRGRALAEVVAEMDKVKTWIRQNMPVFEKVACRDDD
ncbi:MAG: XTP/dITP diphosphatase [Thermodesulfobacteriota bacterium]